MAQLRFNYLPGLAPIVAFVTRPCRLLMLVCLLAFTACSVPAAGDSQLSPSRSDGVDQIDTANQINVDGSVRIAIVVSGDNADRQEAFLYGAELALAERDNAVGGRPVELLQLEWSDATDPTPGIRELEAALAQQRIHGIIADLDSTATDLLASLAEEMMVPLILATGGHQDFTDQREYVFHIAPDDKDRAQALAGFVREQLGLRSAVLVFEEGLLTSRWLAQHFDHEFVALGGYIVQVVGVTPGERDHSLERIVAATGDRAAAALVLALSPQESLQMAADVRAGGFDGQLVSLAAWQESDVAVASGDAFAAADGLLAATTYHSDRAAPETVKFQAAYIDDNGEAALNIGLAALSYDAMTALLEAVQDVTASGRFDPRSDGVTRLELSAAIQRLGELHGASGIITTTKGEGLRRTVLVARLAFKDGAPRFELAAEVTP